MILKRYPATRNHSLQAWNAADEHLVLYISEHPDIIHGNMAIYNDRFGYLSCHLKAYDPDTIVHLASQKKAIRQNMERNFPGSEPSFRVLTENNSGRSNKLALLQIPKSNDLLDLMLFRIHENAADDIRVACGFMTRHFTPTWLEIAGQYFDEVAQSKAWKKSRLLLLSGKKKNAAKKLFIHENSFKDLNIRQYSGVFSKEKIDMATSFLLENFQVHETEKNILDWGCGNGIIGLFIQKKFGPKKMVFMDDSILAVESVRLNDPTADVRWEDNLQSFQTETFDLIVTNPPFHFEYETDISMTLSFFEETTRCLSHDGRLLVVANKHVNYQTHLRRLFQTVDIVKENQKFVIYESKYPLT